jgi:hypothetical protein
MIPRLFLILFIIFCGCNDDLQLASSPEKDSSFSEDVLSASRLIPGLSNIDSMQVVFFNDPFGDSIKYTRYFQFSEMRDEASVNTILQQMEMPLVLRTIRDTCRSDGKIFLLAKGDPVKTIYFTNRCGECCHLYFIKDGIFYYQPLHDNMRKFLLQAGKAIMSGAS